MKENVRWILIVDDDAEIRELVRKKIGNAFGTSVKTIEASDGVEATGKLAFQAFDCIITDLQMPRRQGDAFIRIVKGSQLNSKTPVVILTGHPDPTLLQQFEAITMIEKPFKEEEFIQIIRNQLHLGSTDTRVSSNIINLTLEAAFLFLKEALKLTYEQEKAQAKVPNADLMGEQWGAVIMKAGASQGTFIFGISTALVNHAKTILFPNENDITNDVLIKKINNSIFLSISKTQSWQTSPSSNPPQLIQNIFVGDKNTPNFKQLSSDKGIIVPLKTQHGYFYLTTIAAPQKK